MFTPLLILTAISATGLLLYTRKNIPRTLLSLLIALGAGSMLAVSLVHIFPESFEQTELAVYAFLAGFIMIYLIEELLTPHRHDHSHGDHAHEDPHEHYDHVALVSWIAICAHTLLDGVGIRAGMGLSEAAGYAVLFGVAIHQIPVSLSLAALMRESHFTRRIQIVMVSVFALSAALGYLLSDIILSSVSDITVGLAAAWAGGSLLYIATTDLMPVIHANTRHKYLSVLAFLIGVGLMSLLASHHHHEGEEHHADEMHEMEHMSE